MIYIKRQEKILELLSQCESCSIKYLSELLSVSYNTIYSDINALVNAGHPIKKIHGNVLLNIPVLNIDERQLHQYAEKEIISRLVMDLLPKKQQISFFFDPSTTNLSIAKELAKLKTNIGCTTNYIDLAYITGKYSHITTLVLEGTWWDVEHSLIGDIVVQNISQYYVDIAILGCSGLHIDKGIFNRYTETTLIKKAMAKNATEVWLVCDHTKWGKSVFSYLFDFSDIDIIITDRKPSDEWIEFLATKNVKLVYKE